MSGNTDYDKLNKAQLIEELRLRDANPTEADAKVKALEEMLDKANQALADKDKVIGDQQKELESLLEEVSLNTNTGKKQHFGTFKLNSVNYIITAPKFEYQSRHYKAEELIKNTDLQNELVLMGAGFIKKMEG